MTDSTSVRWELRTSISDFVSTQDQTTAGQAVAVLRAPLTSDEQQLVECSADPASATTTITVNPVAVALHGPSQPLDLAGGQVANLLGTLTPGAPAACSAAGDGASRATGQSPPAPARTR